MISPIESTEVHALDDQLIIRLAGGMSQKQAAEEAGCCEKTVSRRMRDAKFRQKLDATRAVMFDAALGNLAEAAVEAVQTLRSLMGSADERVSLSACKAVVELGGRLREQIEIERRISNLEAAN